MTGSNERTQNHRDRRAATPAELAVISDKGSRDYNTSAEPAYDDNRPLAVFVTEPPTGKVEGGLHGGSYLGQLRVDRFFLPEGRRRGRVGSRGSSRWPRRKAAAAAAPA